MTCEEALNNVNRALSPESLSTLQTDIFRRAWSKQSYYKMAGELNHQYSYIKDLGAELWKLLSQALGIQITKNNLQNALIRYVQQEQMHNKPASSQHNRVDWGEAPDTSQFCGRRAQLDTLEQWVLQERCRLVAIAGIGGIGKTMLATQLAQQLADTGQFKVVVWRSLRQAPPLVDFLTELMSAIASDPLLALRLDVTIHQLLEQLRHHRCLLILDNVEAVMRGNELVGNYQPGCEEYGWLFQQLGAGQHQSSVLLTSREIPTEVAIAEGPTASVRLARLEPLSSEAGETILAAKGLTFPAAQPQVRELIERYKGNPLALEIVATPIKELFDHNIAAFLAQEKLLFKDIRGLLTQQFNRLSWLERQVMYSLAINQQALTAAQLQADLMPSVSQVELRDALVSLDRRSLIEKIKPTSAKPTAQIKLDSVNYTQQPVVMEYVTEQLIERVSQEVEPAQIVYPKSYALLKAQAKDYLPDVQMRLIVQPILARRLEVQGGSENLKQLLRIQQLQAPLQLRYFAESTINLLRQLGADSSHLDLSNLAIWQADLRIVNSHGTFAKYYSHGIDCIYTGNFPRCILIRRVKPPGFMFSINAYSRVFVIATGAGIAFVLPYVARKSHKLRLLWIGNNDLKPYLEQDQLLAIALGSAITRSKAPNVMSAQFLTEIKEMVPGATVKEFDTPQLKSDATWAVINELTRRL